MLLAKIEQEKLQSFVGRSMIVNQQSIRDSLNESDIDLMLEFTKHMIELNYKQAFTIICKNYNADLEQSYINILIEAFFPIVIKNLAQYTLFTQTDTSDDFELFDKIIKQKCDCVKQLPNIIF